LVEARVDVSDRHAERVRLRNVPAPASEHDGRVQVDGLGSVAYDITVGRNFYALVGAASVRLEPAPPTETS
jgi:proline racemase